MSQPVPAYTLGDVPVYSALPPNIDAIAEVFPMARRPGVVFAYAPGIYTPSIQGQIPPEIFIHECVHINRQAELEGGAAEWWDRYLADPDFRYEEELIAHVEEYLAMCRINPSRQNRRGALRHVSKKLSAPLYEYKAISRKQAERDIKQIVEARVDLPGDEV